MGEQLSSQLKDVDVRYACCTIALAGVSLRAYAFLHTVYSHTNTLFRLPPQKIGMIVDRGHDFPDNLQASLEHFGSDMWLFRDEPHRLTTRAMNSYRGDHRG